MDPVDSITPRGCIKDGINKEGCQNVSKGSNKFETLSILGFIFLSDAIGFKTNEDKKIDSVMSYRRK